MAEPTITRVWGSQYDRPDIYGAPSPEWALRASVGAPYDGEGPIVTAIKVSEDRKGVGDFYARLTVWSGDRLLFECPAWFANIEYEHNRQENQMVLPW